jgi:hypothetical protein
MWQLTWMLSFLPSWFWTLLLIGGAVAFVAARFIALYKIPLKLGGAVAVVISLWFLGAASNEAKWEARVKELEAKLAVAEEASKQVNTVVEQKIVKQKEFVKGKTEYITKYIDREVVKDKEVIKYIEMCPVPSAIIDAHNQAARMNKAEGENK